METVRIRLLGGLSVEAGQGISLRRFRTRKTAALLGFVATAGRSGVPRERLIELFWPEDEPKSARASLSTCLASIRSACVDLDIPEVLEADRFAVWLAPLIETDISEFERLVSRSGVEQDTNLRICWLQSALDLYAGPYLHGYDDDWILGERQIRSDEYVRAVRKLLKLLGEVGAKAAAIKVARAGVRSEPSRESLTRDLMRLLMSANEPAAALDVYRNLERNLSNEFGIAPSPKAMRLAEQIEVQRTEPLPLPTLPKARVPRYISTFLGRAKERALVGKLLRQDHIRLVSLVGFGGVGKSRLARESVADVQDEFEDGAYWVALDGYSSANSIWIALAQALDIASQKEPIVIAALQHRNVVLAVDNAEHLLPDLVPHIYRLLGACPRVRMLVTSRVALHMDGDHPVRLGPLQSEEDELALFVSRLSSANPGYDFTESDNQSLRQFIPHLGGIPLAIEMVAASTPVNALDQLVSHIPQFADLASGRVDHQGRHELLSRVIENSIQLLSPAARGLLNRLWPLEAGFTWEAAQDAGNGSGETMAAIRELEDYSIVYPAESRHGHRFMILRVVRECVQAGMSLQNKTDSIRWAAGWLCKGTAPDDCLGYRSEETVINGIHNADNIVAVGRQAYDLGLYDLSADVLTPHSASFKLSDHIPLIIDLTQKLDGNVDSVRQLRLAASATLLAIVGTNDVDWPTPIVDRFLELAEANGDPRYVAVARIYKAVRTVWYSRSYDIATLEVERAMSIPREQRAEVTGNLVELWANEVLIGAGRFSQILESLRRIERTYGIRPGLEQQMFCSELSYCSSYLGHFEEGAAAARQLREICARYGDFPNFGHSFFLEATSLVRAGRYAEALTCYDRHVETMTKYVALDKVAEYVGRGCAVLCCIMLGDREAVRVRRLIHGPDKPLDIYDGILNDELAKVIVAVRVIFERGIPFGRLDNSAANFDFASALMAKLGHTDLASHLAGHADQMREEWGAPVSHALQTLRAHVSPVKIDPTQMDVGQERANLVDQVRTTLQNPGGELLLGSC